MSHSKVAELLGPIQDILITAKCTLLDIKTAQQSSDYWYKMIIFFTLTSEESGVGSEVWLRVALHG